MSGAERDVLVDGAGPAGSATACALASAVGTEALVRDRRGFRVIASWRPE